MTSSTAYSDDIYPLAPGATRSDLQSLQASLFSCDSRVAMFAALCNDDPISCAPITRVAYLVLVSNIVHRPYLMLLFKSWSLIFIPKISSCHPRWYSSKYVRAMANYQISQAFPQDIPQIADMSSSSTTTDPLINAVLRDPSGVSWNSLESRRALALHNYMKGLISYALVANSFILKSCGHVSPHLIEASAWIQHFHPNPSWQVPWKDEPGTFDVPPDCVDVILYNKIEDALHTNRKTNMQGKEHCCSFINSSIPERA